jgi:hypothetical protein
MNKDKTFKWKIFASNELFIKRKIYQRRKIKKEFFKIFKYKLAWYLQILTMTTITINIKQ